MGHPITPQEMVSRVWDHFLVQGEPAGVNPQSGGCLYAGPCAIGIFMTPEQQAEADLEQFTVADVLDMFATGDFSDDVTHDFAERLQAAHDQATGLHDKPLATRTPPEEFRRRLAANLRIVASEFGLTVPQ